MPKKSILLLLVLLLAIGSASGQEPVDSLAIISETVAPVTSLIASDHKYDDADQIFLSWVPSVDDLSIGGKVAAYEVYQVADGGKPVMIGRLLPGANQFSAYGLEDEESYQFYVRTVADGASAESIWTTSLSPEREWVNWGLLNLMVMTLIIGGAILFFIETAKRKKLYVRKIAGLEAVDEAIGRATEMGRPILYIPGIQDMDDVQTLASLTILGRVAEHVAQYDIKIKMPVSRSLVMTAARETIKAAYQTAGRPDGYSDDMVNYVTDEQFGYVAHVDGLMVREKPATVFLLGAFFAESLILAETGNQIGAIQIAGTARPAQLPFFIAACDFTLIGEELFAASAYLSGEPKALGSLKGQDLGKAIAMAAIIAGVALATILELTDSPAVESALELLRGLFTIKD